MLILQTVIKMFNKMREIENTNTLFIICPFCQLENYLRTKFGEDVFFMTATAGVLNFSEDEITAIKYLPLLS